MLTKYKLIAIILCCIGLQVLPLICVSQDHQLVIRIVFICLSFALAGALCIKAPLVSEMSQYIALASVFLNLIGFVCLRAYQSSDQDLLNDYFDINKEEKDLELNLRYFFGFLNGICLAPGMMKVHQVAAISFGILLWSFQSRGVLSVLISISFILEALVIMYLIHSEENGVLAISKNSQKYDYADNNSLQQEHEWIKEFIKNCAPLNLMILTDEMHVYYSTQHFYKVMDAEREEDIWNFLVNQRVQDNQNLFDQLKKKLDSWRKETSKFGLTWTLKNIDIELEQYNLVVGECTIDQRRCLAVLLANSEDNISTFNQYTHKMINSISHDLKTPLNAIILLLDILKDQIKNRQSHQIPHLKVNHNATSPLLLKKAATLSRNPSNPHLFLSSRRISVKDYQFVDPFSQLGQKSVSLRFEQEDQIKPLDSVADAYLPTIQTIRQDPFSAVSGVLIPLQEEDEEEEEQEEKSFKNQATEEWLLQSQQKAASRNHLYHENTNFQGGQGMKNTPSQTMFPKSPSIILSKMKTHRLSPSTSNKKTGHQVDQAKVNTHSQNIQSLVQIKEDEENSIQSQNSSLVSPPVIPHHSGQVLQSVLQAPSPAFKRGHRRHKSKSTPLNNPQLQKSLSTDDKELTPYEQAYQGEFDIASPKVEPNDKDQQSIGERQALLETKQTSILDLNKKSPRGSLLQDHLPAGSNLMKQSKRKISLLNGLQHRQDQVINAIREQNDVKVLFSYISSIEKNGQLLESRINDLIDYSTLLSKKELSLMCTQFDLTDVLMEMDELFGVQARQKKLLLLWPQISIKMKNDKPRIKQILINIIGNAIKFTFEGFIRISVNILESERQQLEISVQDTGIGIPDHILSNMFSFTDHLRQVKDDHRQGVGIGLEICSRLCQIIGPSNQRVLVSSEINAGSKFSFSVYIDHPLYNEEHDLSSALPKSRKKKSQKAPIVTQISFRSENEYEDDRKNHISLPQFTTKKSLLSGEDLHELQVDKKKLQLNSCETKNYDEEHNGEEGDEQETVLIVDDVAFNLIALRNTLKLIYPHLKVIEAQNGKQAVEKVRENNGLLDLVIMDINMPIMDGFQAMQIINDEIKDKTLEYVPIIAHTAFDNNDDKQKCFNLGAKGFLPKPVKRIELQRAIQPYISEQAFQQH